MVNKLGTLDLNRFISIESAVCESQMDPTYKLAGKLFNFIYIHRMVLPMYVGHYVQESVHRKYPATSKYGYTNAKDAIT